MATLPRLMGRPLPEKGENDKHKDRQSMTLSVPRLDLEKAGHGHDKESCDPDRASGLGRLAHVFHNLWMPIIRPPRWVPTEKELRRARLYAVASKGHCWFYERRDTQLKNSRGQRLACSHFVRCEIREQRRPCVVYLHGNSSCRLEVQNVLAYLFQYDVTVFCFDFSGSGQSDGEYVSLGVNEEQDLRVVLDHLRRSRLVSSIALWGWSMGAVTAILRASQDPLISACVLDSPFADFRTLAGELAKAFAPQMPGVFEDFAFQLACEEVRSRAGFDPAELKPIQSSAKISIPALFGVGADDTLTQPHHTKELYKQWSGRKKLHVFQGEHNAARPSWFMSKAARFLWDNYQVDMTDKHNSNRTLTVFPVKADGPISRMIGECLSLKVGEQKGDQMESGIPSHCSPRRVRFPSFKSESMIVDGLD